MKIHCLYDQLIHPKLLKPHPKNRNKHFSDQIRRLGVGIEYQGWRHAIKISKQSGFITSGHARREAAILKRWEEVPVVYQDYENEEQEYADVQFDNNIAQWGEMDRSEINNDLPDLGPDFDLEMLGFKDFVLDISEREDEHKCSECGRILKKRRQ